MNTETQAEQPATLETVKKCMVEKYQLVAYIAGRDDLVKRRKTDVLSEFELECLNSAISELDDSISDWVSDFYLYKIKTPKPMTITSEGFWDNI
jgi:hypothetical protein